MPDTTVAAPAATDPTLRRCWRCLEMFTGDADRPAAGRAEFWMCPPCEAILLPSKQRPS